jgi:hypothetical protein
MVACIDFFEMSEICRPKFTVRHSINFNQLKNFSYETNYVQMYNWWTKKAGTLKISYVCIKFLIVKIKSK